MVAAPRIPLTAMGMTGKRPRTGSGPDAGQARARRPASLHWFSGSGSNIVEEFGDCGSGLKSGEAVAQGWGVDLGMEVGERSGNNGSCTSSRNAHCGSNARRHFAYRDNLACIQAGHWWTRCCDSFRALCVSELMIPSNFSNYQRPCTRGPPMCLVIWRGVRPHCPANATEPLAGDLMPRTPTTSVRDIPGRPRRPGSPEGGGTWFLLMTPLLAQAVGAPYHQASSLLASKV